MTVGMRPRDTREKLLPYRPKSLSEFEVAVQRLVVILPKEEQDVVPKIDTNPAKEDEE